MSIRLIMGYAVLFSIPCMGADLLPAGSVAASIQSEADLVSILEAKQDDFQHVSPPSFSVFIASDSVPYPVDWSGFSPETKKYMTAYMDQYGLPRYALLIYEDLATRDRLITLAAEM